jgi:hypothetical protein
VTPPPSRPAAGETVALSYTGDAPIIMAGPRSGRLYRIDPESRHVPVDRRDVPALVATGRFEQIDG